jgi:hypothetical protein
MVLSGTITSNIGSDWWPIAKSRKVSEGNLIVKKSDNPLRISISGNNKELEENNEIVLTGKDSKNCM